MRFRSRLLLGSMLFGAALTPASPALAQSGSGGASPPRWPPARGEGVLLPASVQQVDDRPTRLLSADEAVAMALEQNLDIRIARIDPQLQDLNVAQARAAWVPTVSTTFMSNNANQPAASFLAGGEEKVTDNLFSNRTDVQQALPWGGGSYSASWNGSRTSTSNIFTSFNPVLRSGLSLGYTQPLLRDYSIDGRRQQIAITTTNREISETELGQTVATTERAVRNAYWDLVYALSYLDVQRQSLELAQESLRNNRIRVEVGTMAPIDIVEAEAEVARNDETVIVAEAQIEQAEDRLRALIMDPATPDFWNIRLRPTDTPLLQAREIDVDAAIDTALRQRTDVRTVRQTLETTDVNIRYYRNQTLPAVNVNLDYNLSGLGGTRLVREPAFPGDFIGVARIGETRNFGSVLSDIFTNAFPTWTIGVTVAYPIGTSDAEAGLARARLQRQQSEARIRNLELRIATEVRNVGRQVTTNLKRVDATRAARQFAEQRLEAEEKKFGVGMSTSFLVFQAQRDLAQARNNEVRAILDYIRSLVDFDAVQAVPVGGGAISTSSTGTTGVAAGSGAAGQP